MSNLDLRHPEDGLLLRYLDGELPGAQGAPGPHPSGSLLAVPRPGRRTASRRSAIACAIARMCWRPACLPRRNPGAAWISNGPMPNWPRNPSCPPGAILLAAPQSRPALGALRRRGAGALLRRRSTASRNPEGGSGRAPAEGGRGLAIASRRRQARAHHHAHRPDDARHRRGLQTGRAAKPKSRACSTPPTTIGTIR